MEFVSLSTTFTQLMEKTCLVGEFYLDMCLAEVFVTFDIVIFPIRGKGYNRGKGEESMER